MYWRPQTLDAEVPRWHLTTRICTAAEITALRRRLPRDARRGLPFVCEVDRAVVVRAVGRDDTPLLTRCAAVHPGELASTVICRIRAEMRRELAS